VGSVVFAYDPNGNRYTATDGTDVTTYNYGADNRLEDITLPGGDILEYWYDADGQRVRRRHKGTPNYNTYYVGGLVEVDTEGSTVTETRTHYSFGGLPVAVRTHEADGTTFVFTDHLGSVTSTWNDTTDTLTLTRYFPYGGERHSSGEMPQDQRYTGQVSDATANASGGSGLLYYNARYYDPTTAQFTQPDTIVPDPSSPTDLNRYSYVRGNPVRSTDPTGHLTCADNTHCRGPGATTAPCFSIGGTGCLDIWGDDAHYALIRYPACVQPGSGRSNYGPCGFELVRVSPWPATPCVTVAAPFNYCGFGTPPNGLESLAAINGLSLDEFVDGPLADIKAGDCAAVPITCEQLNLSSQPCSGPQGAGPYGFEAACARHDLNYRTLERLGNYGTTWTSENRLAADRQFLTDMLDICHTTQCARLAHVYYDGVRLLGNGASVFELPQIGVLAARYRHELLRYSNLQGW
jgi:RHS repeat-associated protein